MKLRVLGVSSGLGVSLFPFRKHVVGNIENRRMFHTLGNEQWESNFPGVPLYKNDPDKNIKADILISSPDCGSGSILRYSRAKKLGDHTKNHSLLLFFNWVNKIKPKFFYFENLPALFKSFPREKFAELLKDYYLVEHMVPVSAWGNSQIHRKRLVIIGIIKELPYKKIKKYFKLPKKIDPRLCGEIYGDLGQPDETICHVREDIDSVISIYGGKKMSLQEIYDAWNSRLKKKTRFYVPDSEGRKFKTAPGVYRNLKDGYPATARKANRQYDHHGLTLSPRQLARIQGVPDNFFLYYDPDKKQYWINKARTTVTKTPPMEISKWFKKQLKKSQHLWK